MTLYTVLFTPTQKTYSKKKKKKVIRFTTSVLEINAINSLSCNVAGYVGRFHL